MSLENDDDSLLAQGVVPRLTLDQLGEPEQCQEGEAPWMSIWNGKADVIVPLRAGCPPLIFGAAVLGKGIHSQDTFLASAEPYKVIRLALQYGIRAFDTSPYYHPSEISLGRILQALSSVYPRNTYYLQSKVGRFGPKSFDYSPNTIKQSVQTSLERLQTHYLDSVLMHDVEFVATPVGPSQEAGFVARDVISKDEKISSAAREACGISTPGLLQDAKIHGKGDEIILDAVRTLFQLKDQKVILNVGIAGYPLPVLLRLSRLVACHPPYRPLDVIVTYCNHTLQNDLVQSYLDLFDEEPIERAEIVKSRGHTSRPPAWRSPTIINASPFAMGLLTENCPAWHPASDELKQAAHDASKLLKAQSPPSSLSVTASRYGLRGSQELSTTTLHHVDNGYCIPKLPTVVGMNTTGQVHDVIRAYRVITAGTLHSMAPLSSKSQRELHDIYKEQEKNERLVLQLFSARNVRDWVWASP